MYQVIARKYRPQTFSGLVGQEHVRTTIENALAQNRIAHGYIFSGQRGTGKTSVARILARCLNCVEGPTITPCGKCSSCIEIAAGNSVDVIEIDAASNRGINEMRELRENVRYRPARDRYKVFIIDEAHQITSEAFNALLKTLEEPPEWVVFLLCTTEAHKFPATITSRCQHFNFRSVPFEDVVGLMERICAQEGVVADADALSALAQSGEGSVRDSLSALDQAIACCGTELKAGEVRALMGAFSVESLHKVTQALGASDARAMLQIVADLELNGHHLQHFSRELARYFRNLLVLRIAGEDSRLVAASPQERHQLAGIAAAFSEQDLTRYLQLSLDLFADLQRSTHPRLHTELGMLRMVEAGRLMPIEEAIARISGAGSASSPPRPSGGGTPTARPRHAALASAGDATAASATRTGDWKTRLYAALMELGQKFTADAVAHSRLVESEGVLRFETPKEFKLSMKEPDLRQALRQAGGGLLKVEVSFVDEVPPAQPAPELTSGVPSQDGQALTERALSHPEVRRFQETLGGQVRGVRNLNQ
jgi:DNA polymerase-3 subunit gamma/tau